MLVGNKCDEEAGKREVTKKMGETLQVRTRESTNQSPDIL